jgi:hypothetical protein
MNQTKIFIRPNVDAAADALRQRLQGGKMLKAWELLPNATKNKWREYAQIVIDAALRKADTL